MGDEIVFLHSGQPLGAGARDALRTYGPQGAAILTDGKGPLFRDVADDSTIEVIRAEKVEWLSIIHARAATSEVVTNDEYCLEECRELRHATGLDDPFPRELSPYRDKAVMRNVLASRGVPVPRGDELPEGGFDLAAVRLAARRSGAGSDVIVKPRREANLRGIFHIEDLRCDPALWIGNIDPMSGYVVEEFLDGPQYHAELLIRDQHIETLMVGRYLAPLLDLAKGRVSGSITIDPSDPRWRQLARLGAAAVEALGTSGRFVAHVEFLSADDRLYVGEVACRAPGGEVPWQCEKYCGIDLERLNLELQMGRPTIPAAPDQAASWIWIPGAFIPPLENTTGGDFVERSLGRGWLSTDIDHETLWRRTVLAQELFSRLLDGGPHT